MKIQDLVYNALEEQARKTSEKQAAARLRSDKLIAALAAMGIEFDDLYISPDDQSLHFSILLDHGDERRTVVIRTWQQRYDSDNYQIHFSCDLCGWCEDWVPLTPENLAKIAIQQATHRCPPEEPSLIAGIEDQIELIEDHYPDERVALAVLVGLRAVVKALMK
jgi:hypothetical protein